MSLDQFFGYWIFAFLCSYGIQVIFSGLRELFPKEERRLKIDFKQND